MEFFVKLLITAAVILLLSYKLGSVYVKDFRTALWVAFLTSTFSTIFSALMAWLYLVSGFANMSTLLVLYLLQSVLSILVMAIMLMLVDKLVANFKLNGFLPALIIAVVTTVLVGFVGLVWGDSEQEDEYARQNTVPKIEIAGVRLATQA